MNSFKLKQFFILVIAIFILLASLIQGKGMIPEQAIKNYNIFHFTNYKIIGTNEYHINKISIIENEKKGIIKYVYFPVSNLINNNLYSIKWTGTYKIKEKLPIDYFGYEYNDSFINVIKFNDISEAKYIVITNKEIKRVIDSENITLNNIEKSKTDYKLSEVKGKYFTYSGSTNINYINNNKYFDKILIFDKDGKLLAGDLFENFKIYN